MKLTAHFFSPTRALTLASAIFAVVALPAFADTPPNELSHAEQRGGWRLLFDGKSADQWRNYRKEEMSKGWVVKNGELVRKEAGAGDIISKDQFEGFELQLEYKISEGGNSGLMFHVTEESDAPWHTGPEIQIQDNVAGHDPQKAGWLYQLYQPVKPAWAIMFENQVGFKSPDVDDATRPVGQWNHIFLRVHPLQSEVCINGVSYYYFNKGSDDWNERVAKSKFAQFPKFGKATKGHVVLQDHGNLVSFHNIKVRDLPADGKTPQPIDGTLPVKAELAFPNLTWEGWQPIDDNGKANPPLRPVHIANAGDGSNRLFIIDQSGMIHVLKNDPQTTEAKLFADLRDRTHHFKLDDEEGMLGFAFHPKFKENGQFFVYYNPEGKPRMAYLSRFTLQKDNPNKADLASEEVLLEINQPFSNHNGGPMDFGPDGMLYIGFGDGGGRNDPMRTSQSLKSFLGCVLRIDVDHQQPGLKYAIPADNPFVGQKGVPGEIFAYGIRNPWRVAFDKATGELWLADVGQDLWEEIDIIRKGGNYGWSVREGNAAFGNAPGAEKVETIDPVWEYDHRIGKSITGGHVYRGKQIPDLVGHYLYGDYISGKIWALQLDPTTHKVVRNMALPWNGLNVLAFGEDEAGESFVTTPSQKGESIYRLVPDPSAASK